MKVNSSKLPIRILPKKAPVQKPDAKKIIATGTGISIRKKGAPAHVISKNDPKDPLVSKKILDSLNLGLINFDQRERDTIAKILVGKSNQVKSKR